MKIIARTYIAGRQHYNTSQIKIGPVQLKWEPTNKYDPFAIKVIQSGIHIGYVPCAINKLIKPGNIANIYLDVTPSKTFPYNWSLVIEQPEFVIPQFLNDLMNFE